MIQQSIHIPFFLWWCVVGVGFVALSPLGSGGQEGGLALLSSQILEFPLHNLILDWGEEGSTFQLFAFSIGSMVLLFSHYYMAWEEISSFRKLMVTFLLLIVLLVLGGNVFSLFWGWEGVGLLSFLLISWSGGRFWASFSSNKAMLYNRGNDFFLLFLLIVESISGGNMFLLSSNEDWSWEVQLPNCLLAISKWTFSLCIFLIVVGNSAQFIFHPWLTSAMEGPTPVSALLHSSTMVVAGVYLLINLFFFVSKSPETMEMIFWSSGITILMASLSALFFSDQNNIIALSTTSQLGFIILLLSLGLRNLAFLHLLLHGFFKALTFLLSGLMIHSHEVGQQDGRKVQFLGGHAYHISFTLASIGLIGLPFLGAFFSNHFLLHLWIWGGSSSFWGGGASTLLLLPLTLMLSVSYSFRLWKSVGIVPSPHPTPFKGGGASPTESPFFVLSPLIFLTLMVLWGGGSILSWEIGGPTGWGVGSSWKFFTLIILLGGVAISSSLPTNSIAGWHYFFSTHWIHWSSASIMGWGGGLSESFLEKYLSPLFLNQWPLQSMSVNASPLTSFFPLVRVLGTSNNNCSSQSLLPTVAATVAPPPPLSLICLILILFMGSQLFM